MTQCIETPAWADEMLDQLAEGRRSFKMEPVGALQRTPLVEEGPVRAQWTRKGKDLIIHLFPADGHEWPPEEEMREILGTLVEDLIGSVSNARAAYTEELDSWGLKLTGYGQRTGPIYEMLTVEFLQRLARMLEAR